MKKAILTWLFCQIVSFSFSQVIITEWSQGTGGASEWVEIGVQEDLDLRGWQFGDYNGTDFMAQVTFNNISAWENVPGGTIIVIYNGGDVATSLPAEDTDFGDNVVVIAHNNTTYFTDETTGIVGWPSSGLFTNNDNTDRPAVVDDGGTVIANGDSPNLDANQVAFRDGDSNWQTGTDPTNATPGSTPLVLPVELIYFDAQIESNQVQLSWKTASETNNAYFILERSRDGNIFHQLTTLDGQGTTNVSHTYSWIDETPLLGFNYYRLKQVDFDNTQTSFKVKVVRFELAASAIKVYPTITQQHLWIALNSETTNEQTFQIVDGLGRPIQQGIIPGNILNFQINVDQLSTGQYYLLIGGNRVSTFTKL